MPSGFADLLRTYRLRQGLSQEALAEAAGISVSSIGTYERGVHSAPHRETVAALADALKLAGAARASFVAAARRAPRGSIERPSGESRRDNLPALVTSFLGRERELSRTVELLRLHRIVTLTGSGGIGKTRLALQAAACVKGEYRDGVWFIDFGGIVEPSLVEAHLALALAIPFPSCRSTDDLIAQCAGRDQLLIFDTCEHLVKPIAELAAAIIAKTTTTSILATSRERLRIAGEVVLRVPTLAVPTASFEKQVDAQAFSAIALFVERAQAVMPEFSLSEKRIETVAAICRRLDGIPLAIELAAARLPSLGLAGLRDKLSDRFAALSLGPRDVAPRQQTLLAAIAWSYDLLDERERSALRALAAFPASFSLEAGVSVCDPDLDESVAVDLILSLAEKSFLTVEHSDEGRDRYLILDSTREFARLLRRPEDVERVMLRFAEWCASFAERCDAIRFTMSTDSWLDMVRPEFESMRTAFDWAMSDDVSNFVLAARILTGVRGYWVLSGRNADLDRFADLLLTKISSEDYPSLCARLLFCKMNEMPMSERPAVLMRARDLVAIENDQIGLIVCNLYLAMSLPDKPADAMRAIDEAERLAKVANLPRVSLETAELRAVALVYAKSYVEARRSFIEIVLRFEAAGESSSAQAAKMVVASTEFLLGNAERAAQIAREVVETTPERNGNVRGYALSLHAMYQAILENDDEAKGALHTLLSGLPFSSGSYVDDAILAMAVVAVRHGQTSTAARLLGFYDVHDLMPGEPGASEACRDIISAELRKVLTAGEIEALMKSGSQLSRSSATEEALTVQGKGSAATAGIDGSG